MFNWPIFAMFFPGASWGAVSAEGLYWGLPLLNPHWPFPPPTSWEHPGHFSRKNFPTHPCSSAPLHLRTS